MTIIVLPISEGNLDRDLLANTKQIATFTQFVLQWGPINISRIIEN